MANRRFTQFFYTLHNKPVLLDCNFIVDVANGNGYGVRSLKGPGIQAVYMHSTAAFTGTSHTSTLIDGISGGTASLAVGMPVQGSGIPAGTKILSIIDSGSLTLSAATTTSTTGSITYQAVGSPNPGLGRAVIVLSDNYNRYYGGFSGFVSQLSGSSLTSGLTAGNPYVIVSVGSSTVAQWNAAGLPVGITPAVGAAFIATATSIAGGGAVQAPLNSGVSSVEVVGDPNQTIISSTANVAGLSSGAYIVVHFLSSKTIALTGNTHTNTVIDNLSSTAGLVVGQAVMGAGIPLGATVATITSATAITISAATTATASVVPMTFVGSYGIVQPADGSSAGLSFYMSNSSIMVQGE